MAKKKHPVLLSLKKQTLVGFRSERGKEQDKERRALMPGKRVSKTGHVYTETRVNRSDNYKKK